MKRRGTLSPLILAILCAIMIVVVPLVARYQHWKHDLKKETCEYQLQQIQAAKDHWAEDTGALCDDEPTLAQLQKYLTEVHTSVAPVCPDGGEYTINTVGNFPTCDFSLMITGQKLTHEMTSQIPE